MHKRILWATFWVTFVALSAASPIGAQSSEEKKPPIYTYVSRWAVPRAQWGDMSKLDDQERALMEKLYAEGTITGYGNFASAIHTEGQPTHGSWFSATSVAGLMKALDALLGRPTATAPVLAASKHWDLIVTSRNYNGRAGKYQGAYLDVAGFEVKPGHSREFYDVVKNSIVPMYEKLLEDGAIISYSIDEEAYHTENPGRISFVYTAPDATGLDKVRAAVEETIEKTPALGPAFSSIINTESHRDFLGRVSNMAQK
jgi:hypothetical protein